MEEGITIPGNEQVLAAAAGLELWLLSLGYPAGTARRIIGVIGRTGCVADAIGPDGLLAHDEATIEAVFVAEFPWIGDTDPAWEKYGAPTAHPPGWDAIEPADEGRISQSIPSRTDGLALALPPVAGGGPDEPSDADWAEYSEWAEWIDRTERDIEGRRPWACDDDRATPRAQGEW